MKEEPFLKKSLFLSDMEILEAVAHHNQEAFSLLYERYAPRIFGLAIKIFKDQSRAEDALQECFLSLWQKAPYFDKDKGSPFSWIMSLCRNRCIDMLRHQENKKQGLENYRAQVNRFETVKHSSTPLDELAEQNERQEIQNLLKQLPPEQWEVLEMAFFQGMSQTEIAHNTKLPLGTVKTRVRLGMKKLKEMLFSNQ